MKPDRVGSPGDGLGHQVRPSGEPIPTPLKAATAYIRERVTGRPDIPGLTVRSSKGYSGPLQALTVVGATPFVRITRARILQFHASHTMLLYVDNRMFGELEGCSQYEILNERRQSLALTPSLPFSFDPTTAQHQDAFTPGPYGPGPLTVSGPTMSPPSYDAFGHGTWAPIHLQVNPLGFVPGVDAKLYAYLNPIGPAGRVLLETQALAAGQTFVFPGTPANNWYMRAWHNLQLDLVLAIGATIQIDAGQRVYAPAKPLDCMTPASGSTKIQLYTDGRAELSSTR